MSYVLVIDDDDDLSNAAAIALRAADHEVAAELSIEKGRASIQERKPDILVLDVMFPEDASAGFKLAQELAKTTPDLPIILLTAVNQEFPLGFSNKDIDGTHMPINEFVEKPVDLAVLSEKITALAAK